jgi:hypothetical protein
MRMSYTAFILVSSAELISKLLTFAVLRIIYYFLLSVSLPWTWIDKHMRQSISPVG